MPDYNDFFDRHRQQATADIAPGVALTPMPTQPPVDFNAIVASICDALSEIAPEELHSQLDQHLFTQMVTQLQLLPYLEQFDAIGHIILGLTQPHLEKLLEFPFFKQLCLDDEGYLYSAANWYKEHQESVQDDYHLEEDEKLIFIRSLIKDHFDTHGCLSCGNFHDFVNLHSESEKKVVVSNYQTQLLEFDVSPLLFNEFIGIIHHVDLENNSNSALKEKLLNLEFSPHRLLTVKHNLPRATFTAVVNHLENLASQEDYERHFTHSSYNYSRYLDTLRLIKNTNSLPEIQLKIVRKIIDFSRWPVDEIKKLLDEIDESLASELIKKIIRDKTHPKIPTFDQLVELMKLLSTKQACHRWIFYFFEAIHFTHFFDLMHEIVYEIGGVEAKHIDQMLDKFVQSYHGDEKNSVKSLNDRLGDIAQLANSNGGRHIKKIYIAVQHLDIKKSFLPAEERDRINTIISCHSFEKLIETLKTSDTSNRELSLSDLQPAISTALQSFTKVKKMVEACNENDWSDLLDAIKPLWRESTMLGVDEFIELATILDKKMIKRSVASEFISYFRLDIKSEDDIVKVIRAKLIHVLCETRLSHYTRNVIKSFKELSSVIEKTHMFDCMPIIHQYFFIKFHRDYAGIITNAKEIIKKLQSEDVSESDTATFLINYSRVCGMKDNDRVMFLKGLVQGEFITLSVETQTLLINLIINRELIPHFKHTNLFHVIDIAGPNLQEAVLDQFTQSELYQEFLFRPTLSHITSLFNLMNDELALQVYSRIKEKIQPGIKDANALIKLLKTLSDKPKLAAAIYTDCAHRSADVTDDLSQLSGDEFISLKIELLRANGKSDSQITAYFVNTSGTECLTSVKSFILSTQGHYEAIKDTLNNLNPDLRDPFLRWLDGENEQQAELGPNSVLTRAYVQLYHQKAHTHTNAHTAFHQTQSAIHARSDIYKRLLMQPHRLPRDENGRFIDNPLDVKLNHLLHSFRSIPDTATHDAVFRVVTLLYKGDKRAFETQIRQQLCDPKSDLYQALNHHTGAGVTLFSRAGPFSLKTRPLIAAQKIISDRTVYDGERSFMI